MCEFLHPTKEIKRILVLPKTSERIILIINQSQHSLSTVDGSGDTHRETDTRRGTNHSECVYVSCLSVYPTTLVSLRGASRIAPTSGTRLRESRDALETSGSSFQALLLGRRLLDGAGRGRGRRLGGAPRLGRRLGRRVRVRVRVSVRVSVSVSVGIIGSG